MSLPLPGSSEDPEAASAVTIFCTDCGQGFVWEDESYGTFVMPRPSVCAKCEHDRIAQRERDLQLGSSTSSLPPDVRFRQLALDGYVDTDLGHPGLHPEALRACLAWLPGEGKGLGLVGRPGLGKSRCIHLALRAAFDSGRRCFAINHFDFGEAAHDASAADTVEEKRVAKARLQRARSAGVLLVDDVGKARHTPARTEAFYALLEHRTQRGLLTLWTGQASAAYLATQYGPDYGPAIARRLGPDFCIIPKLPRE